MKLKKITNCKKKNNFCIINIKLCKKTNKKRSFVILKLCWNN